MSPAVRIALIGFTSFERAHIEAALQPADDHGPRYLVGDDLAASSLAVVNADDEAAVAAVVRQGRLASTVMLGTTQRAGAAAQLPRPIKLVLLLRTLQGLVQTAPPMSAAVQRVQEELAQMRRRLVAAPAPPLHAPTQPASTLTMPFNEGQAAPARTAHKPVDHVLVVDDKDLVLRFLATELEGLGFEVHLVRSGALALERLARRHYRLVFLATGLDGLDSFHTCKTIKRQPVADGRAAPTVVMLLGEDAAVDKVRAEMAGADACLSQPLSAEDLRQVVGEHQPQTPIDAQTTRAASTLF